MIPGGSSPNWKAEPDKLRLAYQFLLAYPGAPAIYYGDEVGLEGGKDPDCRKAFPWNENEWDRDLRNFIQNLISIRKTQHRAPQRDVSGDPGG